jgi:asparagine synthase (glutamine-hydrolysing)
MALSEPEKIKRQGYFNPNLIERLKRRYSQAEFKLNLPFETDRLMIVLTFNILPYQFKLA